jgi:hypothetical protein
MVLANEAPSRGLRLPGEDWTANSPMFCLSQRLPNFILRERAGLRRGGVAPHAVHEGV